MCTGACLAPAAQHWGEWGLGPTPREPPPAGLAPAAPVAPQPCRGFLGYPQPGGGAHPPIPSEGELGEVIGG